MSDTVSTKNTILISEEYKSISSYINFITLKLNIGYNFYSDKLLNNFEVFKDNIYVDFDCNLQDIFSLSGISTEINQILMS
ncbi:hypothetical protein AGMMS49921_12390 [Endomicrobiia bacterium]|nr:hypothetical protein AGMMS49921_12390 [Endomicrobiia bacterium]